MCRGDKSQVDKKKSARVQWMLTTRKGPLLQRAGEQGSP